MLGVLSLTWERNRCCIGALFDITEGQRVLLNFVFKHTINEKWSKQGTETKQLQGSLIG